MTLYLDLKNLLVEEFCFMSWILLQQNPDGSHRAFALSQYSSLPKGSRECLPNFVGDKKYDPHDHIREVTVAYGILGVQEENAFARLFVGSLIENIIDCFQNL